MTDFPSLAHIAVTVTDLERSTQWYTALLGSEPVLDEDEESGAFHHTVYALSGGQLFGLHTHTQPTRDTRSRLNRSPRTSLAASERGPWCSSVRSPALRPGASAVP